eukprot:TRINITY_DN3923_c0_g1_i1.p1 TRINITY_DN3923_c0_g1~~TRINITY_DN3923_c0_g1_i1.p1  ORF type:complete len:718 (+),score=141.18 TRINITY_DN3923_c0_g1_i1:118-2271(+)
MLWFIFSLWWLAASFIPCFMFFFYQFHPIFHLFECFFFAIPASLTLGTWITYLTAASLGGLNTMSLFMSCSVLTAIALFVIPWIKSTSTKQFRGNVSFTSLLLPLFIKELREFKLYWGLLAVSTVIFGHLFHTRLLLHSGTSYMSGGATWSDLSIHMQLTTSFVFGENKHLSLFSIPKSIIFSGYTLSYPFLPDFQSAIILAAGSTERQCILLPSILLIMSFTTLLYSFNLRFTRSSFTSLIAVTLTIFAGGIGAFSLLFENSKPYESVRDVIVNSDFTQWYYWMDNGQRKEKELFWFSLVAHVLYPQRSSLFVFPMTLSVFHFFFVAHKNSTKLRNRERNLLFLLSGVTTGLLPMIQGHAFVGMAFFAAVLAAVTGLTQVFIFNITLYPKATFGVRINPMRLKQYIIQWFYYGIPLLVLSIPQLLLFVGRVAGSNEFFVFKSVWAGRSTNFFVLWFEALGLFVFLSFMGVEFLKANQMRFYIASIGVFFLCNLCIFTPWDKDNIKTFYLWVFVASGVVAKVLVKLASAEVTTKDPKVLVPKAKQQQLGNKKRTIAFSILAIIIYLSLIFTGVCGVYREANHNYPFVDEEDYEVAYWVRDNTPSDAYFVISDHHINPVTTLGGKTSLIGFTGWASSHGYPWYPRHLDRNKIYMPSTSSEELTALIKKLDVSYVVFDPRARNEFHSSPETHPFWLEKATRVFKSSRYTIYDVRKVREG